MAELEAFRKEKCLGLEFQRFLCVWLRVAQDMSTFSIAKTIGWNVNTVRMKQKAFIDRGTAALTESKRGGRNHAHLTPEDEKELIASFEGTAESSAMRVAGEVRRALERRLGHEVNKTTVGEISCEIRSASTGN
ncbi:MAG: hypothetical protein LBL51_06660 [Synergistaceae bacterium]|jgi:transposase|nr:hypothetical protein [Synergistaceae bacterium]